MRTLPVVALFLFACGAGAKQTAETAKEAIQDRPPAGAALEPRSGSAVTGFVEARPVEGGTQLTVRIANATPGKHGVHLHETGDCSAQDATSAGGHWNPDAAQHGGPGAGHAGDMGNLEVGDDGAGTLTLTVAKPLAEVKGKAVIVHAGADDLTSQPSGDSGGRVACGVIVDTP